MLKKIRLHALQALVTVIAFAAATGIGAYCWVSNYQPEPPKELR